MMEEITGRIVHREQVAHVTFILTEEGPDAYDLYSSSKEKGVQQLAWCVPHAEALALLQDEITALNNRIADKRQQRHPGRDVCRAHPGEYANVPLQ